MVSVSLELPVMNSVRLLDSQLLILKFEMLSLSVVSIKLHILTPNYLFFPVIQHDSM